MSSLPAEERYPLLLLYVDDKGKKSEFPQRVVFADKGRGNQVSKGAAAIITQWPAQVTSCWLTSIVLGSAFIFMSLILLMSSLSQILHPVRPRCIRDVSNFQTNRTVYLVKHGSNWTRKQLDILKFVADVYPDFEIQTIMVDTTMNMFKKAEQKYKEEKKQNEHIHFMNTPDITNTFFTKLNELFFEPLGTEVETYVEPPRNILHNSLNFRKNSTFLNRIRRSITFAKNSKTYDEITKEYPNIKEKKTTFRKFFQNTPLQYFWMELSPKMVIFAMRIQELWQNGGISFHLPTDNELTRNVSTSNFTVTVVQNATQAKQNPNNINKTLNHEMPNDDIVHLKLLITSTKLQFDTIPEDHVSVDGQGMHMATRTPCHSFFGEMLMKLQKDYDVTNSITEFIQKILNTFCARGAVDSDFCKKQEH